LYLCRLGAFENSQRIGGGDGFRRGSGLRAARSSDCARDREAQTEQQSATTRDETAHDVRLL